MNSDFIFFLLNVLNYLHLWTNVSFVVFFSVLQHQKSESRQGDFFYLLCTCGIAVYFGHRIFGHIFHISTLFCMNFRGKPFCGCRNCIFWWIDIHNCYILSCSSSRKKITAKNYFKTDENESLFCFSNYWWFID